MLEIIPDALEERTLEAVEAEILILKDQAARHMIEIGKRLMEAQEMVPRGEWKLWLSEHVQFSYRTAARMMAAAREFGDMPALGHLDSSKIYALLDAPEELRAEFTADPKALEEKSVRQLQAEIKARKAAEERAKELEAGLRLAMDQGEAAVEEARMEAQRESVQALLRAQEAAEARVNELRAQLEASVAREKEARAALMNAQLVRPDTALAVENARLQAELLAARDALNRAEKADQAEAQENASPEALFRAHIQQRFEKFI